MLKWVIAALACVSTAWADTAIHAPTSAHQPAQGGLMSMLPMLIIFVVAVYFLIIRPQQKRTKEQKQLNDSMKVGDEVMTTSGIVAKISSMSDQFVTLTISNGVDVRFQKQAIVSILPKGSIES